MHLFSVLYCAHTFKLVCSLLSSFFSIHSPGKPSLSLLLAFAPLLSLSYTHVCAAVPLVELCQQTGMLCLCVTSTPECRDTLNHLLPWPLNKLMFYGCTALPNLFLLKGRRCLCMALIPGLSLYTLPVCTHLWEYREYQ